MTQLRRSSDWLSTVASRMPDEVTTQASRSTGPREAAGGFSAKAAEAAATRISAMQERRAFMQTSWTLPVGTARAQEVPFAIGLLLCLRSRGLALGGFGFRLGLGGLGLLRLLLLRHFLAQPRLAFEFLFRGKAGEIFHR